MENDIYNLDPNDVGLKGIFGDRFHDVSEEVKPQKPVRKPVDASWEPTAPANNWLDNLKACAKSATIFGGLSILVFYWQQAGLMDSSIAVPTMCVCAALAGLGVGKNIQG